MGQSNAFKANALLTIAMCKQSLKASAAEIIAAAEACRIVNPEGKIAVNARYVIVTNEQSPDKTTRLRALYDEARKKRCEASCIVRAPGELQTASFARARGGVRGTPAQRTGTP